MTNQTRLRTAFGTLLLALVAATGAAAEHRPADPALAAAVASPLRSTRLSPAIASGIRWQSSRSSGWLRIKPSSSFGPAAATGPIFWDPIWLGEGATTLRSQRPRIRKISRT